MTPFGFGVSDIMRKMRRRTEYTEWYHWPVFMLLATRNRDLIAPLDAEFREHFRIVCPGSFPADRCPDGVTPSAYIELGTTRLGLLTSLISLIIPSNLSS